MDPARQGLLDAIAQAGTRGAEDYKNAQAALAAQQQEATRLALASGVNNGMPQGAQDAVANIIAQGYQPRAAQMTSNQATMGDYYNRLGANANTFATNIEGLIPAINQQFENQLALKMASGGGGSGGGSGRSSKGKAPLDDFSQLLKDYHGIGNLKAALPQLAREQGVDTAELASQLGVPSDLASAWFPSYETKTQGAIQSALHPKKGPAYTVRQFRADAQTVARSMPGNQMQQRKQLVQQYKKTVQQQKQQAKKKGKHG